MIFGCILHVTLKKFVVKMLTSSVLSKLATIHPLLTDNETCTSERFNRDGLMLKGITNYSMLVFNLE